MLTCYCILAGTATCRRCTARASIDSSFYSDDEIAFTMLFDKDIYTGTHENVFVTPKGAKS
jgi:hypothetical protein